MTAIIQEREPIALAESAAIDPLAADASHDRWQTAVVAVGRRALASNNPTLLIDDAASLLADALGLDISGVALANGDGTLSVQLTPARAGVQCAAATHRNSDRADESLSGFALSQSQPIAIGDLAGESRFRDAVLRRSGVKSALACPLKLGNQAYGVLLVAHQSSYWFTEHDLMCVETIGHLITTTIARNRAEQALTEQLRFDAALLNTVEAMVVALDADSRILNINRACAELVGFSIGEMRQRPISGVLIAPEDTAAMQAILARLEPNAPPAQFECMILTKHGARRRIAWAFTRVEGGEQGSLALMGAGVDVTEKWEMENRMQRACARRAAEPQLGESGRAESNPSAASDEIDAEQEASRPKRSDRRVRQRRAYPYMQRMATITNGRMPSLSEFREVECNDIGAGGFSYFTPTRPVEADIVVAFGSGTAQTYLTARLVHVTAKINHGERVFLVGCRYTGRHTYSR